MSDLEERLVQAAEAAIRNERPALEALVGRVVGLTIELVLNGAGRRPRGRLLCRKALVGRGLVGTVRGEEGAA